MMKGDVLKNQEFERYFMSEIETVDATVVDFIGEYIVVVNIGGETHKATFSLAGTLRSRGVIEESTRRQNNMKMRNATTPYGKQRVIEDWQGFARIYVKKTNLRTYVAYHELPGTLDNMVEINGEYHFGTLKEMKKALEATA